MAPREPADGRHAAASTAAPVGRRSLLAGMASVGIVGLAGCLGGGGPDEPTATPHDLPPPVAGDPDAPVTVAVYEDFSCPHCATYNREVLPALRDAYLEPGTVRYEHHDFPIPVDDWSWPAASAARAVQDRADDDAFFDYADRLYAQQDAYSLDRFAAAAEAVGVAPDPVRDAAATETYRPVVAADREAGVERGVSGTPTAFVDDEPVTPSFDALRDAIEAAR